MYQRKTNAFLAHLAEGRESLCHDAASVIRRPSSVRRQLFHLNDFFSSNH